MNALVSPRATGSGRRFALGFGIALLAGALLAPPAIAVDNWSGVWETRHKFGTPKLILEKQGDRVEGIYKDRGGDLKGKIHGDLGERNRVWEGKYRDTRGGDDHGKFWVELCGGNDCFHVKGVPEGVGEFQGWFKSCRGSGCGERVVWLAILRS